MCGHCNGVSCANSAEFTFEETDDSNVNQSTEMLNMDNVEDNEEDNAAENVTGKRSYYEPRTSDPRWTTDKDGAQNTSFTDTC